MTLKAREKAQLKSEEAIKEVINEMTKKNENEVGSVKKGSYEVRFFERDLPKYDYENHSCSGIGVDLTVKLYKEDNFIETIWSGVVRGNGRYEDNFSHWYRDCDEIKEFGDKIIVTISSKIRRDTYEIEKEKVFLKENINLEKIEKEEKARKLLEEAAIQENLKERAEKMVYAYASIKEESGTRSPNVYYEVAEKDGIVVNLVGLYRTGYDPAMKELVILVNGDEYKVVNLRSYYNPHNVPKYSSTKVMIKSLEIKEKCVILEGEIFQKNSSGSNRSRVIAYVKEVIKLKGESKSA